MNPNVSLDILLSYPKSVSFNFSDFIFQPFTICFYDINELQYNSNSPVDLTAIFEDALNSTLYDSELKSKIFKIDNGLYLFMNATRMDFYFMLEQYASFNSLIFLDEDFITKRNSTLNTLLRAVSNIKTHVFFADHSTYGSNYQSIINSIFEYACERGFSFYYDSGISRFGMNYVDAQINAAVSNNNNSCWMFYVINMPVFFDIQKFNNSAIAHNVFLTSGYIVSYRAEDIRREAEGIINNNNTLNPAIIYEMLPASVLYAEFVSSGYSSNLAYSSVIKAVLRVNTQLDKVVKESELPLYKIKKINPIVLKDVLRFVTNKTLYNSNNILSNEHVSRLAIDIARLLSFYLKSLMGSNKNIKEIESVLRNTGTAIKTQILSLSPFNEHEFTIALNKVEGNKLYVDVYYYDYTIVEYIKIMTIVSLFEENS